MGLRWWGCAIERCAKVRWTWAPHQKPSHWGSVLADDMRGGLYSCRGDLFGVGKRGVEVVGARN